MTAVTSPERSFEVAVANSVGMIQSGLEQILDRNPDLPPVVRQRLAVLVGKCMPLTNAGHLKRWSETYAQCVEVLEVRFTEAPPDGAGVG